MKQLLLFTTLLLLTIFCPAQKTVDKKLQTFIQQKGDSLLKAQKLPGLFVGLLNKGQRQYFSFGYAVPEKKIPFDAATVFEAGSITKTFTAFIVESVLQEKGIADSSAIGPYLPDSIKGNYTLADVRFLSLLNHTSGLPRLPVNLALASKAPYDQYTQNDLFSYLNSATPKPDGKSSYSNLGMGLAGVLAQRISGKNYSALLQQYVTGPFGMQQKSAAKTKPQKAQGFFDGTPVPFWNMDALAPAGSLQMTAEEMLTYLQGMMKPTPPAKKTVNLLLQPTVQMTPNLQVGRGWMILKTKAGRTLYWHNGGTYGFSTFVAFDPEREQAVVVVVNRFNANNVSDVLGMELMQKIGN